MFHFFWVQSGIFLFYIYYHSNRFLFLKYANQGKTNYDVSLTIHARVCIILENSHQHFFVFAETFSGLTATMKFRRRSMYYIFQMYIPCVCIVALSWVSFWINHEAVPARVALSITTVLTISYMRGSVNAGMPRVSYLKSIDYFLLGGFVFIFMTLLEYVLVLKQSRKLHIFHEKKNDYELTENGEDQVNLSIIISI